MSKRSKITKPIPSFATLVLPSMLPTHHLTPNCDTLAPMIVKRRPKENQFLANVINRARSLLENAILQTLNIKWSLESLYFTHI